MKRLYLLRHGVAVPHGTPGIAEDERPLTPKGERRVRQVARGLWRLGVQADRIVTSPLPRAYKTAEIAAKVLGDVELLEVADALRPENRAESIRAWLDTRPEDRLMIVGHNPSFDELVGVLTGASSAKTIGELKKGGVAAFVARPEGGFALDWLARPRLLRRIV